MKKGFTIVELIVVMGIIGLLAAAAVVSYSSQQASARDTRRFEDVRKISDSLEFYYEDNGKYASAKTHAKDTSIGTSNTVATDWATNSDLRGIVSAGYIDSLPIDPINSADYYYQFVLENNLQGYLIEAVRLEKKPGNANGGTTFTLKSNSPTL